MAQKKKQKKKQEIQVEKRGEKIGLIGTAFLKPVM